MVIASGAVYHFGYPAELSGHFERLGNIFSEPERGT